MVEGAIWAKVLREWGLVNIKNPFKEDKSTLSSELDAELVHANLGD